MLHNWMSLFENYSLWDLVLPGSHDSAAYISKNKLLYLQKYMLTQSLSIYEQMKAGVRVLDLRVVGYINYEEDGPDAKMEYWLAHTAIIVPLKLVLQEILTFINENPSEVLVLEFRADWSPVNADHFFQAKPHQSQVIRLVDTNKDDLIGFI